MGNILFISGVTLTIGLTSTMQFFMKRQNFKGTISFGIGFFLVVIGWPILGMILEAYGFVVLFSGFWPTLAVFLQKISVLGWIFQQTFVRSTHQMVLSEGPTFNIIDNLTESESQSDLISNGDDGRPHMNIGHHDYPPGHIIPNKRKGRSIARNVALKKKKEKGEPFDIEIPMPYSAICGDDAAKLKTEICCLIRYFAPHNVMSWKYVDNEARELLWTNLKAATFDLPASYYDPVMKQFGAQFRARHNKLHDMYKQGKGCPDDLPVEQWDWLIKNKWNTDDFKKKSGINHDNRLKVKLPSTSGTKKIIQTAYDLKKKSETKEWPTAPEVWKNSRKRKNGEWSIPDGEEKLKQLELMGEVHKDEIAAAPIPLVKHFGYVLERSKGGYVPGLGISGVTKGFEERTRFRMETDAAIKRANSLDQEVDKLKHQMENQEIRHQAEIDSLKHQVNELLGRNGVERPPQTNQSNMDDGLADRELSSPGLVGGEWSPSELKMLHALLPMLRSCPPRN